jgi:DNA repair protein SbcC/Rad50
MTILSIAYKNINSLKGEGVIDFTCAPLKDVGLFAITGPTGSGKSTILDIIALALYNTTPRLSKISKTTIETTGGILTRGCDDAYARVTYRCAKGVFTSLWSIDTARTGNLKDYHMEIRDEEKDVLLPLKKSDVSAKNQELIGLDYHQFIKSAMLAQGEFAAFLKADKHERTRLLERITDGWMYREIGKRAFEKKKGFEKELEQLNTLEKQFAEGLWTPEVEEEKKTAYALAYAQLKALDKQKQQLQQQIDLRKEWADLQEKNNKYADAVKKAQKELDDYTRSEGQKLKRYRALLPLDAQFTRYEKTHDEHNRLTRSLENKKAELEQLKTQMRQLHKSVEALLGKTVNEAEAEKSLQAFETVYNQLEAERSELKLKYDAEEKLLRRLAKTAEFSIPENLPDTLVADIKSEIDNAVAGIQSVTGLDETERSAPETALHKLKSVREHIQNYADTLRRFSETTEKYIVAEAELSELREEHKEKPAALKLLKAEADKAELSLENAQLEQKNRALVASLEEHRRALKAGEPCPLCGSTEHPFTAHLSGDEDNKMEGPVIKAKKRRDTLRKQLENESTALSRLEERIRNTERQYKEFREDKARLENTLDGLRGRVPKVWQSRQPDDIIRQMREKEHSLNAMLQYMQRKSALEELLPRAEKTLSIITKGRAVREKRNALTTEARPMERLRVLRDTRTRHATALERLTRDITMLQSDKDVQSKALEQIEYELGTPLKEQGYDSIDEALKWRLRADAAETLQQQERRHTEVLQQAHTRLEEVQVQLEEKKTTLPEAELSALKVQKEENDDKLKAEGERHRKLFSELEQQEKDKKKLETNKRQRNDLLKDNEKWLLLAEYIGDAQGNRFSIFAQQLTLQQLIALANRRLKGLNNRYLLDIPASEDDPLEIIDNDMGMMRRSISTLSGGETFLVSLALALGLSDLASRTVEINSMFIDEGFGSLDPVSLDLTLDTLEKLQMESNKTIGIISHVELLKERIQTQIAVEQNGQGFSKLRIFHPDYGLPE